MILTKAVFSGLQRASLICVAIAAATLPACRPALSGESVEERSYPSYTPAEASVFDDSISESVISGGPWLPDSKFEDRVRRSDSVTPARILTVTEQPRVQGLPLFVVELQPFGHTLAGRRDAERVRLELAPDNPAYRLFRWQRRNLLGKDVVLFYRRYSEGDGITVHFRAEPNTPQVHYAVGNPSPRT